MALIVVLTGSPTPDSRSSELARRAARHLVGLGHEVVAIDVRDLPAQALLHGDVSAPAIATALAKVAASQGVIAISPVYKATYTGVLKSFLDVLPHLGLAGKVALPILGARQSGHALALDHGLRPVLAALSARLVTNGVFVLDEELERRSPGEFVASDGLAARLAGELDLFASILPVG